MSIFLRPATAADVNSVFNIQKECYVESLHEDHETLLTHLVAEGAHNMVAVVKPDGDGDDTVIAYSLAHPWHWKDAAMPSLGAALETHSYLSPRKLSTIPGEGEQESTKSNADGDLKEEREEELNHPAKAAALDATAGLEYYDTLYFHDIAVTPSFQGKGAAKMMMDATLKGSLSPKQQVQLRLNEPISADAAYTRAQLVAVGGADTYWARFGFEAWVPAAGRSDEERKGFESYAGALSGHADVAGPVMMVKSLTTS